jgi:hypothetical protein
MYATPMGAGKTTYTFSANANVISPNFPFSVLPAGGVGMGQAEETEVHWRWRKTYTLIYPHLTPIGYFLQHVQFQ